MTTKKLEIISTEFKCACCSKIHTGISDIIEVHDSTQQTTCRAAKACVINHIKAMQYKAANAQEILCSCGKAIHPDIAIDLHDGEVTSIFKKLMDNMKRVDYGIIVDPFIVSKHKFSLVDSKQNVYDKNIYEACHLIPTCPFHYTTIKHYLLRMDNNPNKLCPCSSPLVFDYIKILPELVKLISKKNSHWIPN